MKPARTDRSASLYALAALAASAALAPAAALARGGEHKVAGKIDGVKVEVTGVSIGQADYTPPGRDDFVPTTDDYLKVAIRITNEGSQPLYVQKYWTDTSCKVGSDTWRLHDMASILLVAVKGDVFNLEVAPGASVDDLLLFRGADRAAPPTGKLKVEAKAPFFRQPGMAPIKRNEIALQLDASLIAVEARRDPPPVAAAPAAGKPDPAAEPPLSPEDELLVKRLGPLFAVPARVRDGVVTIEYQFVDAGELGDFGVSAPDRVTAMGGLVAKKQGKIATRARFTSVEVEASVTFDYLSSGTSAFFITMLEGEPGDFGAMSFGVQAISARDGRVKKSNPKSFNPAKLFRVQQGYEMKASFAGGDLAGALDGGKTGHLEKLRDYDAGAVGFEWSETNFTVHRLVIRGRLDPEWIAQQPSE